MPQAITLRFYLTCADVLDDTEFHILVMYPDGTNEYEYNSATSAKVISGTKTVDPMGTGTTLSTDSTSTYTSGQTYKYYVDVDTSGEAGADCAPIVYVFVGTSSTIYLDTVFDAVA